VLGPLIGCFLNNKTQSVYTCPKKNTLDANGHCSGAINSIPGDAGCSAYCEVRLTMTYGEEVPYPGSACEGPYDDTANITCTISTGSTVTVTNSAAFNVGVTLSRRDSAASAVQLKAAFNLGASYTWSESVSYAL
jgi:hypothetical protein